MLADVKTKAGGSAQSLATVLYKTATEKGVDAAIQQYRELKAAKPDAYDFKEDQLNNLGYWLLMDKQTKGAIKILKLNAELFPKSANVYDSLGEALIDDGDKKGAAENYRKSVELDPSNSNAAQKLKELGGQ